MVTSFIYILIQGSWMCCRKEADVVSKKKKKRLHTAEFQRGQRVILLHKKNYLYKKNL